MIMRCFVLVIVSLFAASVQAEKINQSDSFAQLGVAKYAGGFPHFDYANPAAPKGGRVTLSAIGTYDNFNRFAMRGSPGVGTESLYDHLFTLSLIHI